MYNCHSYMIISCIRMQLSFIDFFLFMQLFVLFQQVYGQLSQLVAFETRT